MEELTLTKQGDTWTLAVQHSPSGSSYGCDLSEDAYQQLRQHFLSQLSDRFFKTVTGKIIDLEQISAIGETTRLEEKRVNVLYLVYLKLHQKPLTISAYEYAPHHSTWPFRTSEREQLYKSIKMEFDKDKEALIKAWHTWANQIGTFGING